MSFFFLSSLPWLTWYSTSHRVHSLFFTSMLWQIKRAQKLVSDIKSQRKVYTPKKLLAASETSRVVSESAAEKAPQTRRANKNVLWIMSIFNIAQCPRVNSHGDLALFAARTNLIFTSHSIDFQLIFTYFSLFVAEPFFSAARLLLVPLMFSAVCTFSSSFSCLAKAKKRIETKIFIPFAILPPSALLHRVCLSGGCHQIHSPCDHWEEGEQRAVEWKIPFDKGELLNQLIPMLLCNCSAGI